MPIKNPPHPGDFIRTEIIEPAGLSVTAAAAALGVSRPTLSSLLNGKLRYLLGELSALPRAAIVVEDRYSQIFKLSWVRPALVADGIAELQVRWPGVPIVFCEARQLAEEWTYRYLAAAWQWAITEPAAQARTATIDPLLLSAPDRPDPTVAEVRTWARQAGLDVPDRGRLRPEIWAAWRTAH